MGKNRLEAFSDGVIAILFQSEFGCAEFEREKQK
jgi:hypothetical protein